MTSIISIILFTIFTTLSLLHFYWLFGGKWGLEKVIPTKENQTSALQIPQFATLVVAVVLQVFGLIYLIKVRPFDIKFPYLVIEYGYWIIPSIFILRTIGDFKYVGLFKKIRHTEFAKADSKWFIPLCLTIGFLGLLIAITNP
ncbi:MAG: DUF3995 domain-containing protein [Putridiphycobacter sp.]